MKTSNAKRISLISFFLLLVFNSLSFAEHLDARGDVVLFENDEIHIKKERNFTKEEKLTRDGFAVVSIFLFLLGIGIQFLPKSGCADRGIMLMFLGFVWLIIAGVAWETPKFWSMMKWIWDFLMVILSPLFKLIS